MDLAAGVAAFQPFKGQFKALETGRNGFTGQRQVRGEVDPTRAAHVNFTLFFGVGVDQDIRLQPVGLQAKGAVHTGFFRHGQQHFQRAMNNVVVSQHRQRGSHADTVIGAQSRAARFDPLAVDVRLNRVLSEVVNGIVVFLRHHIEVRLQHYRFAVFHTGSGAFTNQNVANLVAFRV